MVYERLLVPALNEPVTGLVVKPFNHSGEAFHISLLYLYLAFILFILLFNYMEKFEPLTLDVLRKRFCRKRKCKTVKFYETYNPSENPNYVDRKTLVKNRYKLNGHLIEKDTTTGKTKRFKGWLKKTRDFTPEPNKHYTLSGHTRRSGHRKYNNGGLMVCPDKVLSTNCATGRSWVKAKKGRKTMDASKGKGKATTYTDPYSLPQPTTYTIPPPPVVTEPARY
jgi:hypothetical protein